MRLLFAFAFLMFVTPAHAQHLGARVQWQPQTMAADARLDQPVEIEIIGRAAVPALAMLTEKTGVSLTVAPEDLNTVGERKLTLIAKGLTLKAIMVQLPEALQEAHWDIDTSGGEPVYLLHRNGSAGQTMEWLMKRDEERRAEQQRAERVNRMEEAKRALQLSPEELSELEKTDPLLARSVRDPHSRDLLELLLTLPPEQAEQFRETGKVYIPYPEASERLQQAVLRIGKMWRPERAGEEPSGDNTPEEIRNWQAYLPHDLVKFEDERVDHGFGVRLTLAIPTSQGYMQENYMNHGISDVALFPHYFSLDDGESRLTRLLMAMGVPDKQTAFDLAVQQDKQGLRAGYAKREERREREWIEPTDPDLLQTIIIGEEQFPEFADAQRFIATQTGLSVLADYFTLPGCYIPDEYRQGVPLWRLLYLMGEDGFRPEDVYLWKKTGNVIVFHRVDWPALAKAEAPEWVIADFRRRLEHKDKFELDDLTELAVTLDSLGLAAGRLPGELQKAGSYAADSSRWALLLYASLTPDQQARLSTPEGLSFEDMTLAQRQRVLERALQRPVPFIREQAYRATFHLVNREEEAHERVFDLQELQLRFLEVTDTAVITMKLRIPAKASEGAK